MLAAGLDNWLGSLLRQHLGHIALRSRFKLSLSLASVEDVKQAQECFFPWPALREGWASLVRTENNNVPTIVDISPRMAQPPTKGSWARELELGEARG